MPTKTANDNRPAPRTILTATDFSPTAQVGVAAAAHLASTSGARLHLLHAVDLSYTASTPIGLTTEFIEGIMADAQRKLEESVEDLSTAGLEIELEVRNGGAADALLEEANHVDADLIVIGTRGRSGIAHAVLGSTAEHVLQRTSRPVLSLHEEDSAPDSPPSRILIPTDLGGDAALALEGARRLLGASPEQTSIVLLHVVEVPGSGGRNVAAESWTRMLSKLKTFASEELESTAEEIRREGFSVEVCVRLGSAANVILEEALVREPDAIVMRTAERSALGRVFLGSTARRVVQRANCPVLTIRWSEVGS